MKHLFLSQNTVAMSFLKTCSLYCLGIVHDGCSQVMEFCFIFGMMRCIKVYSKSLHQVVFDLEWGPPDKSKESQRFRSQYFVVICQLFGPLNTFSAIPVLHNEFFQELFRKDQDYSLNPDFDIPRLRE